jgi:hypothetical protein
MHEIEDHARQWAKSEKEDFDSLSESIKRIKAILKSRIKHVRTLYHQLIHSPL